MCARVSHRSRILNVHFCDMSSCVDLKRVEGTFVSPLVICNTAFAVASPAAIAATTTTTTSPKDMAVPSTNILSKETISYISCCRQERLSCYICVYILTPEDVKVLPSIVNSTRPLTEAGSGQDRWRWTFLFTGRIYIFLRPSSRPQKLLLPRG